MNGSRSKGGSSGCIFQVLETNSAPYKISENNKTNELNKNI